MTSLTILSDSKDDPVDLLAGVCECHRKAALDREALEKDLSEQELTCVSELRERLVDEPITAKDTATLIRFSRARQLNVDKAEDMLRNMLKWRRENIPPGGFPEKAEDLPELVQEELAKGKMFYLKNNFDIDGRQIFICRSYLFEKGIDLETSKQALVFLTESARKRKKHPLEKICCIWDASDFSYTSQYDSGFFKQFNSVLADNFPESLHCTIIYPLNWIFLGIYKVVEWFLAEETKKKLCFLKVGDEDKILMYIAKEDLLKELGGDVSINTPENRNDVVTLSEDKVVEAKRKKKEFLEASTEKMGNDWAGCTELFLEWAKQP
jgi:hypothetical protein